VNTIRAELKDTVLSAEYSYLTQRPPLTGRLIKKIFEIYCKILFTLYCPLKVLGRENIPDSSFIFCSNHNSHMDSGVLMTASGLPFKNFAMMAAKDYFFDNEKRKYYLNLLMNLIPVDRNANRRSIIEYLAACREFTKNKTSILIIYPEGTRSRTGEMQVFKKGPAMISAELGLPIVPAFIKGTFQAWPKGKIFIKPRRIIIKIGNPIFPKDFNLSHNNSKFSVYKDITKELEKRVRELMISESNHA
jgi:1-acyl-sn-glycerol-3-phosphate acyltransferase